MANESLSPALAALAADPDSTTVRKLWKALGADERAEAISASFADDSNGWVKSSTRAAVAGALRFRPQSVAAFPRQKLISEAARLTIDDAALLSAFLVDFHLTHRRPMMGQFLDALGIPNDEGRIDSEKTDVPDQDPVRLAQAADALLAGFSADAVVVYFLTLLLQDATTWGGIRGWLVDQGR